MVRRVPDTEIEKSKGREAGRRHIESGAFELAGEVGMPPVAPLLARLDGNDLAGRQAPQPTGAKGNDAVALEQPTTRGPFLD